MWSPAVCFAPKDYRVSFIIPKCWTFCPPLFFPSVLTEAILTHQALQICSLHLTSNVTHLSPSYCSSLCAFTPHSLYHCIIYLFYSPSAPKLCQPTIPPTPCALTALSLDGSSSSKAVTMMDCWLPQPLPLPFTLSRSALAVKALTRCQ